MLYTAVTNISLLPTWLHAGTYSDLCVNQNTHRTYGGDCELRNSSSSHCMIPRLCICMTTDTNSSYFGRKFQK